jgi:hypothetical protein
MKNNMNISCSQTRAAGMAAATFGRKTQFKSAAAIRNSVRTVEADNEVAEGVAEYYTRNK